MADPVAEAVEKAALAVREAAAASAGEQAELFALPVQASPQLEAIASANRKAGRPPGAENKGSRELRQWLLGRGVLPQAAVMQWIAGGPEVLWSFVTEGKAMGDFEGRAALRAKVLDSWLRTAMELGGYFLPKMQPVDDAGRVVPAMFMFAPGGGLMSAEGGQAPPWDYLKPIEQNQALSEAGDGESQKDESQ